MSDTVITLQEEVELLRTQCLERENEQNEVELLRMQCAEKEQQVQNTAGRDRMLIKAFP